MKEDIFDVIKVGDEAEIVRHVRAEDVDLFVELTGDDNPLHVDNDFASRTSLKSRVVHGMLTASFISTLIGTKLPGEGALWYEQNMKFLAPVRIGEEIRVWAKVIKKSQAQRILVLETVVFNSEKKKVIDGISKVKVMKQKDSRNTELPKGEKGAVVISGASNGIGAATARKLAEDKYGVIINYLSNEQHAMTLRDEIIKGGGRAEVFQADVSDYASVEKMLDFAQKKFGRISGIVNNASPKINNLSFEQLNWEDFQDHIDIQIKGIFNMCKASIPNMLENNEGVIVNIGSVFADNVPPKNLMHYIVAKAAVISFTRNLAVEYGPKGIRVNCVSPGMTETNMISDVPEKVKIMTKVQTPLKRLAEPEDSADVVSFLFSEKARFIAGQNIRVCGGIVME